MVFVVINIIAFILVLIGSINWALLGIFNWNLVTAIFGAINAGAVVVYVLIALASLWLLFALFFQGKRILFCREDVESNGRRKY